MKKNYIKLSLFIINILLLFILSCDDGYPDQISDSDYTYELTLTSTIEGGEIDYADFNNLDYRSFVVGLKKCDEDNVCSSADLPDNRNITFAWTITPEPSGIDNPYLLINSGSNSGSAVLQNGTASIPEEGYLNLVWQDRGFQADAIVLGCQYTDDYTNTYQSDNINFEVRSIYETIDDIGSIEYIVANIEYDIEENENNTKTGKIGAIVKNGLAVVEGANVYLKEPDDPSINEFNGYSPNITFDDQDLKIATGSDGKAYFDFNLEIETELINTIAANNDAIQLSYILYLEDEDLLSAENNGVCSLDEDNDGVCEIKTNVNLTLTTEAFSIAGTLDTISLTVTPESFILDSDDQTMYEIVIYAEALTSDGGILIPPEDQFIDFRFSRTPEIGSIINSEVDSDDGTATALLRGEFATNIGDTITIKTAIYEEGVALDSLNQQVEIISQEATLIDDIEFFELTINPSFIISPVNTDTTFTINIVATVQNITGIGIENIDVHFQNNSAPIGDLSSGVETTNSSGLASTTLDNVTGENIGTISITAYIVDPTDVCEAENSDSGFDNNGYPICSTTSTMVITNNELLAYDLLANGGTLSMLLNPSLLLFNDLPGSEHTEEDSTSTDSDNENEISISASVKDSMGGAISGVPVYFSNSNPILGTLTASVATSGSDGIALNTLQNISPSESTIDKIGITANILYPSNDSIVITTTDSAEIAFQSIYNISLVQNLDAVFLQDFSLINNINIQYEDSLIAQVLDVFNVPVQDVPINFALTTSDIGYLSTAIGWSDSIGIAGTKFVITPADMQQDNDTVDIALRVYVGENTLLDTTITRKYVIQGSANVEDDVDEFHYYPQSVDTIILYSNPNIGASIQLPYITKDSEGVRIEGVPIQFQLYESGTRAYGSLNTSLQITCCSQDSSATDSLLDWNNDGVATIEENMGIASVIYENAISSTFDKIRAFITNPVDQSQMLFEDTITIITQPPEEQVSSLYAYALPQTIYMNSTDSVYCDTVFAIARDGAGQSLQHIPINFALDQNDLNYGTITSSNTATDTISQLPAGIFGAKTVFCTWPNISIVEDTVTIDIQASINNNSSVSPANVNIYLIEDLPECPDCQASLELTSQYYELPAGDNDIFTTTITATVIDSTENPVPPFTLVEFQSLTLNEDGDLVQIGNIEPYKYTDSNGQATATFNMGNDVGLAQIIGNSPQFNLADTIYVSLYSTSASSMEIIQPFPNEITVQGGGGIESTELNVHVKDGNGNLVSEPFLVYFEILSNAPNGVYLNETDEDNFVECVESSNGIATVTLNSGNIPGSVPLRVELYDIDDLENDTLIINGGNPIECSDINSTTFNTYGITYAEAIPVTVVTGPPSFGQINYSYVDIQPIGGGLYEVPLSVHLWDYYSNPVADSTNVYIWIEGLAEPWSGDSTYVEGDTVKYGELDSDNDPIIIDSLLYACIETPLFSGLPPNNVLSDASWNPVPHPGAVDGEAKTGMLAPDNQSYPGVAWSNVYYGTSDIFAGTVVKALTYDGDGNKLVIDSRESHNNEPLVLPFQPGSLSAASSIQFWDFSVFGDVGLNDLDDTVAVNISANLTDYYQYPVADGDVLINAPGANIWLVCDPGDTDGDGYVGECWEDINGNGIIDLPPFGGDQINADLGSTCTLCGANGGLWNYDDSAGEFNQNDGDGVPDDDPAYGRTNGNGQIVWLISYSEALNAGDGGNPETYNDFTSTVTLQLLDPIQTASDGVDILLTKSESNDNP